MTPIKIPNLLERYPDNSKFIAWMQDNVGAFNVDWKWLTMESFSISVKVKNPQKALLVALRWGAK